ncbi:MAG: hypothetical protein HRT90_02745 [Candidatus Margulisbacteria bacterium]|nr:hypothetical protein [Candidatus Margulisiibacteriota bacterium]
MKAPHDAKYNEPYQAQPQTNSSRFSTSPKRPPEGKDDAGGLKSMKTTELIKMLNGDADLSEINRLKEILKVKLKYAVDMASICSERNSFIPQSLCYVIQYLDLEDPELIVIVLDSLREIISTCGNKLKKDDIAYFMTVNRKIVGNFSDAERFDGMTRTSQLKLLQLFCDIYMLSIFLAQKSEQGMPKISRAAKNNTKAFLESCCTNFDGNKVGEYYLHMISEVVKRYSSAGSFSNKHGETAVNVATILINVVEMTLTGATPEKLIHTSRALFRLVKTSKNARRDPGFKFALYYLSMRTLQLENVHIESELKIINTFIKENADKTILATVAVFLGELGKKIDTSQNLSIVVDELLKLAAYDRRLSNCSQVRLTAINALSEIASHTQSTKILSFISDNVKGRKHSREIKKLKRECNERQLILSKLEFEVFRAKGSHFKDNILHEELAAEIQEIAIEYDPEHEGIHFSDAFENFYSETEPTTS